jgi:DNA-binding transcriptional LysR family regulator
MKTSAGGAGLSAMPAFESTQISTILALVEAGFGIGVLPVFAIASSRSRRSIARLLSAPTVLRDIVVIHRDDRSLSPAAEISSSHCNSVPKHWCHC